MNTLGSTAAVQSAVAALAAGRMVVVTDDVDRENEGDLVVAAELATVEQMAFLVRHTTGIVCVPISGERTAGSTVSGSRSLPGSRTQLRHRRERALPAHQT